jgi:hypothetical protein
MISVWYIVGWVVIAVCLLIGVGFTIFGLSDGDGTVVWLLGVPTIVLTLAIGGWGMWPPFDMEYHRYKHVAGTVDSIDPRMLSDGQGGTSQLYPIRLREDGQTYRCDDSRCALVKPGDRIELWCIRQWQYASTHGWVCNFDKTVPAAR